MPYKAFCDRCDKETERNYASNHESITDGEWSIEIRVAHKGTSNQGILCQDCLFEIIRGGNQTKITQRRVSVQGNVTGSTIITGNNNIL